MTDCGVVDINGHEVRPRVDAREVLTDRGILPTYREGAVRYTGDRWGRPAAGVGYLEMTGYAEKLDIGAIHSPTCEPVSGAELRTASRFCEDPAGASGRFGRSQSN